MLMVCFILDCNHQLPRHVESLQGSESFITLRIRVRNTIMCNPITPSLSQMILSSERSTSLRIQSKASFIWNPGAFQLSYDLNGHFMKHSIHEIDQAEPKRSKAFSSSGSPRLRMTNYLKAPYHVKHQSPLAFRGYAVL